MTKTYRRISTDIKAVQVSWANWNDVLGFIGENALTDTPNGTFAKMSEEFSDTCDEKGPMYISLWLFTAHGQLTEFKHGDWIIPDSKPGTWYPCLPEVFKKTYEEVV